MSINPTSITTEHPKAIQRFCNHCKKVLYRGRTRNPKNAYCNKACQMAHTRFQTNCDTCGKPVIRRLKNRKACKSGKFFCSRACTNKFIGPLKRQRALSGFPNTALEYLKASKSYDAHSNRLLRVRAMLKIHNPIECINCGCDFIAIIEINHKNGGGGKEFAKGNDKFYRAIANGERTTDDLELRCKVCNILHFVEFKHGVKGLRVTYEKTADLPPSTAGQTA